MKIIGCIATALLMIRWCYCDIIITEIMYHSANIDSEAEWVEIANVGATSVDIGGWYLSDADGATGAIPFGTLLPAGQLAVLYSYVPGVFINAWGAGISVLQLSPWGAGGLNDVSEALTLRDFNGSSVDSVNYKLDGTLWPTTTQGVSVYLTSNALSSTANDNGANWALSVVGVDGARNNSPNAEYDHLDTGSPGFVTGIVPEPNVGCLIILGASMSLWTRWLTRGFTVRLTRGGLAVR